MRNIFLYKAIDNLNNRVVKSCCFAKSEHEFLQITKRQNIVPFSYTKKAMPSNLLEKFILPFLQELHILISNNLDIANSLSIVMCSFEKMEYKSIVEYILFKIKNGSSVHKAMDDTGIFDNVCIKTIEISEKTATLGSALQHVIEYLEESLETKNLMKGAMIYPMMLLIVISTVTLFWIFFIVPNFAETFNDIGIEIPFVTKCLLNFRNFCSSHGLLLMFAITALAVLFTVKRKKIADNLPFVRTINSGLRNIRFFSSMSLMLVESIDFVEATKLSAQAANAKSFENSASQIINDLKHGCTVSESFKKSKLFSNLEMSIMESGEMAGSMLSAFKIIASMLKRDIKRKISKMTAMLQPVITVVMGLILIIIVYSIFLPMYDQLSKI